MDMGSVATDNGVCTKPSEYVTMWDGRRSAMPPSTAEAAGSSVARWLDRHEQRRRSGLPTVSVISGPSWLSSQALEQWAHGRGRSLAWFKGICPRPEDVACGWVERVVARQDLADAATEWLARRIDGSAEELAQSLRVTTPMELAMYPRPGLAATFGHGGRDGLQMGAHAIDRGCFARAAGRRNRPRAGFGTQRSFSTLAESARGPG